jgi:hypothetical protein
MPPSFAHLFSRLVLLLITQFIQSCRPNLISRLVQSPYFWSRNSHSHAALICFTGWSSPLTSDHAIHTVMLPWFVLQAGPVPLLWSRLQEGIHGGGLGQQWAAWFQGLYSERGVSCFFTVRVVCPGGGQCSKSQGCSFFGANWCTTCRFCCMTRC